MSALDRDESPLADRLGPTTNNVLLLAPAMASCEDDGCVDLLEPPGADDRDLLFVTFVQSPDERLERYRSTSEAEAPARVGFVDAGDSTRSAAAVAGSSATPADAISVRTVSNAGDLTDLGIKLSTYLSEWSPDGRRIVVCVHSLSTLLQYADLQRVFRFLHVLTGRVRSADALAHYHMDPAAHDGQTRNTLSTLFDGIAEWDGEAWRVRNQ